ncbi:hypothetical protein [Halorussus halophilus]|uniref:hypothetical protein n=1 Tax=Halorussus halophilus TaxID=2650975 RepID=UPI001300D94E|nr:hypothetical protein [Halorussus halophilus]
MTNARPRLLALSVVLLLILAGCSASEPQRATTNVETEAGGTVTASGDVVETQVSGTTESRATSKTQTTRGANDDGDGDASSDQSADDQSEQSNDVAAQADSRNSTVARTGNVSVVSQTDADGDGYATAFVLQIRANTTLVDTDLGGQDGDPYFVVTVGDSEVATTEQVERRLNETLTVEINESKLSDVTRKSKTVTVTLRDRDLLTDDEIASWSVEIDVESATDDEQGGESGNEEAGNKESGNETTTGV